MWAGLQLEEIRCCLMDVSASSFHIEEPDTSKLLVLHWLGMRTLSPAKVHILVHVKGLYSTANL